MVIIDEHANILQGGCLRSSVQAQGCSDRRSLLQPPRRGGGKKQTWFQNERTKAQGREVTCPRSLNN